jgi:hypothetical protein
MALFGAPIAHEDSASRAVHVALGIQARMEALNRSLQAELGISLGLRIGLNTGPVVVGRIGDDLRMDYTAVGDTTNLSRRMQQAARPGAVVITEATHAATRGLFETVELGELVVKGPRTGTGVRSGPRPRPSRAPGARGGTRPLAARRPLPRAIDVGASGVKSAINRLATAAPQSSQRHTFLEWSRVRAATEDVDRQLR